MSYKKGFRQYKNMGLETSKEKDFIYKEAMKEEARKNEDIPLYGIQPSEFYGADATLEEAKEEVRGRGSILRAKELNPHPTVEERVKAVRSREEEIRAIQDLMDLIKEEIETLREVNLWLSDERYPK